MKNEWTLQQLGSQHGKRAFITGANSGIGYHTALHLAQAGATVVLACRDRGRGQQAVERIQKAVPGALVELQVLDLASLDSVRESAAQELANDLPLDLLINNAGVMAPPQTQRNG